MQSLILKLLPVPACLLGWWCGPAQAFPADEDKVPWHHPAISTILATNPPPPKPSTPRDRSRAALKALERPTRKPAEDHLPPLYRTAGLESETPESDVDMRERQDMLRVAEWLDEARFLTRSGAPNAAYEMLHRRYTQLETRQSRLFALSRLGTLAFRLQDYKAAADHMRKALELDPRNAPLTCNLAAALMTDGNVTEALYYLNQINPALVENLSSRFSVFFNLACAHSMLGNQDKAMDNLEQAALVDAANTMASLGDPQLDNIRGSDDFQRLQRWLDRLLAPSANLRN